MKFLLDMHISGEVAKRLRATGFNVFQLRERGLQTMEDFDIVGLAESEDRVVVTFDMDFSGILARTGKLKPSVIQFRLDHPGSSVVEMWIRTLIETYQQQLQAGCILSILPDRIRVRMLPL